MGGTLTLESTAGQGSTFTFEARFPLAKERQPVPRREVGLGELHASAGELRGRRVLLVEDNPINQLVASRFLAGVGMLVTTVGNGEEALAVLQTQAFDVALMDIQMPVLDGLETTRRIRSNPAWLDLPIIAMSAGVTLEERDDCERVGMNAFLAKPIEHPLVIETLLRLLPARR
jgi:CheY-like chemotaxis protein